MRKLLSIVLIVCVFGCTKKEEKTQSVVEPPIAVVDGVRIDKEAIRKCLDFRMGLFEVNLQLNFPMRKLNLSKIRERQMEKYLRNAKQETILKAVISAAAKKAGVIARPEDLDRIRGQYEMNIGRRAGSYASVTSLVATVGFLKEFENFIEEEARSLSYARSLHPEVSFDISESDIDEAIEKKRENEKRVAEFNATVYQTATNVLNRLKSGEDFAKLAKEFSCADDKDEGGDMGDIILSGESAYSNYAPAYLSALMMKDGALSEVVTTPLGVEIFQVVEHREQEKPDDPIIKNLRHICFELRPPVGAYTRDSVRKNLLSKRLAELYSADTILRALDEIEVEIPGVADVRGYIMGDFEGKGRE